MIYNNVFVFINEIAKMNYKYNDFNTFRCIKNKYLIDVLFATFNDVYKFYQKHQIDFSQKLVDRRMKNNTENDILNKKNLFCFQRLMKNINFNAKIFKNCDELVKINFNSRNKISLKQNNFSRMRKEIHNKFIFEKIAAMIIMSKNLKKNQLIKRDILIQNIENDNLIFIFY